MTFTYSSSFAMFFFKNHFYRWLGATKIYHQSPKTWKSLSGLDRWSLRRLLGSAVPWPAAATEITWFARRTQHISGRGTVFFPAMSRCLVLVGRSYTLSNVAVENSLLLDDFFQYGYGSIPIHTIFSGMNIHLPAILGFTRYQGFDPSPYVPIFPMDFP